jgi:hypothetical protein
MNILVINRLQIISSPAQTPAPDCAQLEGDCAKHGGHAHEAP